MATTTVSPQAGMPATSLVRMASGWQALVAVAGLGLAIALLTTTWERDWLRLIVIGLAVVIAIASGVAAGLLAQRRSRGRLLAVLINYVLLVGCGLLLFHTLGFYTSLDTVAERFHGSAFWLVGVLAGYLIGSAGDRAVNDPGTQRRLHQAGNLVISASLIILLVTMLRPDDLVWLLGQLFQPAALGLLAATVLAGVAFWLLARARMAGLFHTSSRDAEILSGYLFIGPNLIGFLLFFAGPLLLSLFLSFTDSDSFTFTFTGLENYLSIFSLNIAQLQNATQRASAVLAQGSFELFRFDLFGASYVVGATDRLFWIGLWNTIVYCFWTTLLSVVPALLVANLLNSRIPGMQFFRAVYFLPSVAGVVGVAVIWKWLYNSQVGFLNYGLSGIVNALNVLPGVNLPEPQIAWLARPETALASIIIMGAWQVLGINTILFLAGLQGIPREIYEAATVDGANAWQRFRSMTLPLLAPTTFFVITTTLITTLQVFSEVVVMTAPPGGGPNNSTLTAVLYMYQRGFQQFEQGYAAALAWVLFLFIFAVTLVQFRIQRAGVEG